MIAEALEREAENAAYTGGFAVTISVEGGAETAKRTFNPHIGVEGGLSILGTSGIVEPMSQQAILDTIQLEMNQAALRTKNAPGPRRLVLAPGNYGLDYLASALPQFERFPVVKTSNFIGDTLDMAATAKFEEVLLVGHVGKLCKLAAGVMNTHSHTADGRAEVFCAHAALCGAAHEVCAALMDAATTDACLDILDGAQLRAPVLESILPPSDASGPTGRRGVPGGRGAVLQPARPAGRDKNGKGADAGMAELKGTFTVSASAPATRS